jgi:hypothetical protein
MQGLVGHINPKTSRSGAPLIIFLFAVFCLGKIADPGGNFADISQVDLADPALPFEEPGPIIGKIVGIGGSQPYPRNYYSLIIRFACHNFS